MHSVEVFVLLLALVAGVPLLANKVHIPYPALLVLTGLGLCFVPGLPVFHLSPNLIFLFVLPPLVYRASIGTSWRDFRNDLRPIVLLGVGLVLFTTVTVGYVVKFMLPSLPWAAAFALGAIVSPSDTVAAIAIMKKLRIPRRVVAILEGESLINDATGLIAYKFAVAAVLSGAFSMSHAVGAFVWALFGGIAIGWLVYRLVAAIQSRLDDPPVQAVISLATPFVAYLPAEILHASGIISVVTTGLFVGSNIATLVTARMRLLVFPMWEMIEFVLNGFIFIVIGLQLPVVMHNLAGTPVRLLADLAAAVCAAVVITRVVWVFPATYLPRALIPGIRKRDPYPAAGPVALVSWIGMRGVVSLAAALALPLSLDSGDPFPGRDLIIFLTFSVILFTLVAQGVTLAPVVRWLNLPQDDSHDREETLGWRRADEAALLRLEQLQKEKRHSEEALARARQTIEAELALCEDVEARKAVSSGLASPYSRMGPVEREVVHAKRRTIVQLERDGELSAFVATQILRELDLIEAALH